MKLQTKYKILSLLLFFIALAAVYPVIHHYSSKKLAALPKYVTYQKAIGIISDSIRINAQKYHCNHYIIPLKKVESPNKSLDYLKLDLDLALKSYQGWHIKVDETEKEEMIKRSEQFLSEWGKMPNIGQELENMTVSREHAALLTKYSTSAKWLYLKNVGGNDVKIVFTIYRNSTRSQLFSISQTFIHPDTLKKIFAVRNKQKRQLASMNNLADISTKFMFGFIGLFGLTVIGFGGESVYQTQKRKKMEGFLLKEISKREILVQDGHYVTAYELADKYVRYFPDDSEIKAFRERLLDFTNNNPKAAQEAYVMAKKLQRRVGEFSGNPSQLLLSNEENTSIKALLPYHPELNKVYDQVIKLDNQTKKEKEFSVFVNQVNQYIDNGDLYRAADWVKSKKSQFGGTPEWKDLNRTIFDKIQQCENDFDVINQLFSKGDIDDGISSLYEFLNKYRDHETSQKLNEELRHIKNCQRFKLTFSESKAVVDLIFKKRVTFGREDYDDSPDILFNDRRISRNHLTISIRNNQCLVEDQNSTGGTFLNGNRIQSSELNNGDILNLSKIREFKVQVYKNKEGIIGGVILNRKGQSIFIVVSQLGFRIDGEEFTMEKPDHTIFYQSGIPILTWNGHFAIISEKEIQTKMGSLKIDEL